VAVAVTGTKLVTAVLAGPPLVAFAESIHALTIHASFLTARLLFASFAAIALVALTRQQLVAFSTARAVIQAVLYGAVCSTPAIVAHALPLWRRTGW